MILRSKAISSNLQFKFVNLEYIQEKGEEGERVYVQITKNTGVLKIVQFSLEILTSLLVLIFIFKSNRDKIFV